MIGIIKRRKLWLIITGIIISASLISLLIFGLNLGNDFTGGSLIEIRFIDSRPDKTALEDAVKNMGVKNITTQTSGEDAYFIRLETITEDKHQEILGELTKQYSPLEEKSFESIGPTIGQELKRKAIYALLLVSSGIILYLAYSFRKVSGSVSSWKFGVCAVFALFHDVTVVLGVFSLLGKYLDVQIDSLFVVALLTVLGFSVSDTIVVFDPIRYNFLKQTGNSVEEMAEQGVNQTLVRSINTNFVTLLVLMALYLFGGETLSWFLLALIIGIAAGTYS